MVLSFPDEVEWRLHETWRARLFEAQYRYAQNRNHETKAEYMRILRTFKDLRPQSHVGSEWRTIADGAVALLRDIAPAENARGKEIR